MEHIIWEGKLILNLHNNQDLLNQEIIQILLYKQKNYVNQVMLNGKNSMMHVVMSVGLLEYQEERAQV